MNSKEFQQWLQSHRAAFPSLAAWLGRLDRTARHDDDLRSVDVLRTWLRVLSDVTLEDATAATESLANGDEETPRSFDEHARTVRRISKRHSSDRMGETKRRRYLDGEETFRCLDCRDVGLVTVWHPKSIEAAKVSNLHHPEHNKEGRVARYSCAVACHCEAGGRRRHVTEDRYDPAKCCAWLGHDDAANWNSLFGWLENQVCGTEWNPDSGHEGF